MTSTRRGSDTSGRTVRLLVLAGFLASLLTVLPLPQVAVPRAVAAADIGVSQAISANTLIGRETPVELTFTNGGDSPAYNLAFTVTLPLGVTVSSSDQAPTRTITLTDAAGDPTGTVAVWENIVDIVPGSRFRFRYSLQHDDGSGPGQWSVGETIDAPVDVYVSDVDADRPTVQASSADPVTAVPSGFTDSGRAAGATTLVPVLLTKSEPSPEGELLRGAHDHQTVYTLTLETGEAGGVGLGVVEDWLPAGLEFLGCGTVDNSATEEYPGSGPLNQGNAPAVLDCRPPDVVETVDSGLPPGLPPGVYTHVVWNVGASLPASSTSVVRYVAAVPQRENTLSWPGGAPAPGGGLQAANLDNNTGPLTTQVGDGTTWTNRAQVATDFNGQTTVVSDTQSVQAMDLSVQKTVDTPTIAQGAISTWTLRIRTSEYVVEDGVRGLVVTDVTPDGTCPIGSVRTECAGITAPPPAPSYTSTTADADGTTSLRWDLSAESIGPSRERRISFSTVALDQYADGDPVSANDTWTNRVDLGADVVTFDQRGPDDPAATSTNAVTDDSTREQSGTSITFAKDVGLAPAGEACDDGTRVSWFPDVVDAVGPGDRVCFRLTVTPPSYLDTRDVSLVDFLPPGFRFEPGSSFPGPDNEVPEDIVDGAVVTGTPATGQRLEWTLVPGEVVQPAQTAQIVFSAVLDGGLPPDLGASGDTFTNAARFSFRNTNGEVFVRPDTGAVTFAEAHLALTKGITAVVPPVGPPQTFAEPGVPEARSVTGGSEVTYTVTVTNDGTRDAVAAQVRDLLPRNAATPGEDATCAQVVLVSAGGTCADGAITWDGIDVPAGGTTTLTYTWNLPDPVPVAFDWTNRAGVVDYRSTTNTGADFTYVPRSNIDPARESEANTDPADDTARVFSPGIAVTKTRTTSIAGPGNDAETQATIGERITYTVIALQPGGTTAQDLALVDDLSGRGQDLVESSVVVEYDPGSPPGACDYGSLPPSTVVDTTGNAVRVSDPGPLAPADGTEACLRLTFDAIVRDVPVGADTLNRRPGAVTNTAVVTYDFDDNAGGVRSGSLGASVSTQVVEPNIAIDKRASAATSVLPGTEVTYTLVVTNRTAAGVSTAHDVVVTDDFGGVPVESVTDPDGGTVTGDTISWTIPDIAPGASRTLRYTVRLQDDLVANTLLTNTATATATSIGGPSGDERTAGSPCSPAACPGYTSTDDAQLRVAGPLLSKTRRTRLHGVGGEAVFVVRAEFPAGLDFGASSISDDLAGGRTSFVRTESITCVGCTSAERDAITRPEDNGTSGGDPRWDLGVLPPSGFTRIYTITYDVRVRDLPGTVQGTTLTNTARVGYATGSLTANASIDVAEPDVRITKQVATDTDPRLAGTTPAAPRRGAIGDTVTYELVLTNAGGWAAYDVAVRDVPDTVETGTSCSGTPRLSVDSVADGTFYDVTDATLGAGDSCLGFTVPVILPGDTVRVRYTLDVPDDFPVADLVTGPELVNQASVRSYSSVPAADRPGNPDVRPYPATIPTAEAHVDLDGAALGNLVWLDVDGDGDGPDTPGGGDDPDEPGIPGVDVVVTWAGPDATFGTADDETSRRTTDAAGRWRTDDTTAPPTLLPAGDYRVRVDAATLPPGLIGTFDADGPPFGESQVTLAENAVDLDQDFGYTGAQSLGDRVWLDLDADGVQDPDEDGLNGVGVTVTWAGFDATLGTADDLDYTAVTSGDGDYTVDDLPAGAFTVTVDAASLPVGGLAPTYDLDDTTSAPDGTTARTLTVGEDATDVDFGYGGTNEVGDRVWFDTDGDGVQDAGERGLGDVGLEVTWWGLDGAFGGGDDVTTVATTGPEGIWRADGIPDGDVRVAVVAASVPTGLQQTYDPDGVLDATTVRTLSGPGDVDPDADFGYTGVHEVGDMVWLDLDGDGDGPRTPGTGAEPGVPGQDVRVTWAGVDATLGTPDDVVLGTATTGPDGGWRMVRVPSGVVDATLVGAPATSLRVSFDRSGPLDGTGVATIGASDDFDLDFDFGLAGTASLGDEVWLDLDRDGTFDEGEPAVPGVGLRVEWAGFDDDLATTGDNVDLGPVTTDARGRYAVQDLPPGRHRVTVDTATLPAGLVPTHDLDGITTPSTAIRVLAPGEDARDVDFGYNGTGRIGDFVWWDLDGDGVQDAGEPGLPGVGVTLDWAGFDGTPGNADDLRLSARTGSRGGYLFTGLPAGRHRVSIATGDLPRGVRATADPDGGGDSTSTLTLAGGASDLTQDFGYVGDLAIGDLVWRDTDADGTRQPDEQALAGVGVTVTYLGRDGVAGGGDDVAVRQTTGSPPTTSARAERGGAPSGDDPFYRVDGLAPGAYAVELDTATLPANDAPTSDLDGGDPSRTLVTLDAAPQLDADFAVFANDAPTFDAVAAEEAGLSLPCDGTVVIDPFDFVDDVNGDDLSIVPGSIEVPAGVSVSRTEAGRLRVRTSGDRDFTLTYRVSDGRDGTVRVDLPIEVTTACPEVGDAGGDVSEDDDGVQLPGTGAEVPVWLVWVALGLLASGGALLLLALRRRAQG